MIVLPETFTNKLDGRQDLTGSLHLALHRFDRWMQDNKLEFFPGYTDHGPTHICEVLESSSQLITGDAWPVVTPEDIVVLSLAALLHDCAMHISAAGFHTLLSERWNERLFPTDRPYSELYDDFIREASRFSAAKLDAVFGSVEPIRRPPEDTSQWTERDRLLIGEFLRRHHPRIAHEIAMFGVPGPEDTNRLNMNEVDDKLRGLAGHAARSHGHSFRTCIDWFERRRRRLCNNVHMPFVMAVLRIADYVQFHPERAPNEVLQVRALTSPLSRREWALHGAVTDIHVKADDPEAMYVEVEPQDPQTFVRARGLLGGLQSELDAVWAGLGEVYGRVEEEKSLGLILRRVRSNLDDVERDTFAFYPEGLRFEAAPEVLRLLVGPLYSDDPKVGVRELLQNAVDACRERVDADPDGLEQPGVTIDLDLRDPENPALVVTDQGIGMTADTIRNYFLRAGASYRGSETWRKLHTDEDGRTRVARSGRFGVGALASFLLGPRIEVTTRHLREERGWRFEAGIDDSVVGLWRCDAEVGTTIRVSLNPNAVLRPPRAERPRWARYHLASPPVQRRCLYPDHTENVRAEHLVPGEAGAPGWHRIETERYASVHWSDVGDHLYCNGLAICDTRRVPSTPTTNDYWKIIRPSVSIIDHEGNLPLNLARNALTCEDAVFDLVEKDVVTDYCAKIVAMVDVGAAEDEVPRGSSRPIHGRQRHAPWAMTSRGQFLIGRRELTRRKPRRVVLAARFDRAHVAALPDNTCAVVIPLFSTLGDFDINLRSLLLREQRRRRTGEQPWPFALPRMSGSRVVVATELAARSRKKLPKMITDEYVETKLDSHGTILDYRHPGLGDLALPELAASVAQGLESPHGPLYVEWYLDWADVEDCEPSFVEQAVVDALGTTLIPWDKTERAQLVEQSSDRLKYFLQAHEANAAGTVGPR